MICPECKKNGISILDKYLLTPFASLRCKCCGEKLKTPMFITISLMSMDYLILMYLIYLAFIESSIFYIILFFIVMIVFDGIKIFFLPLKIKSGRLD